MQNLYPRTRLAGTKDPACWARRLPWLAAALVLLFATCAYGQPLSLSGVENGVAAALNDADQAAGLAVLDALGVKWNLNDPFWHRTADEVLREQQAQLDAFLERSYPQDAKEINRIAVQLPPLADSLVRLFSDRPNDQGLLNYDVLRKASALGAPAQRLMLGMRGKVPGVDAYIVANAAKFFDVRTEILANLDHVAASDLAFAIDFAGASRTRVDEPILRGALASEDPNLVRAAAQYLSTAPAANSPTLAAAVADAFSKPQGEAAWAALITARVTAYPEAGMDAVRTAGGIKGLATPVKQVAALLAAARSATSLSGTDANEVWQDAASCDLRAAGVTYVARRFKKGATTSEFDRSGVTAALLLLTYSGADCAGPTVARALEELTNSGALANPLAVRESVAQAMAAEMNPRAGDWVSHAPAFCRAIKAVTPILAENSGRATQLLAAGVASCIRSTDAEFGVLLDWAVAKASDPADPAVRRDNQGENGATIWMRMPPRGCRREGVARP